MMTLPVAASWYQREGLADGVTWLAEPHVGDKRAFCSPATPLAMR
jgi:hypothetical protein